MALEWELPVGSFCQGVSRLSVHGYFLAEERGKKRQKNCTIFSTAVLHGCEGKRGGSSPVVGRDPLCGHG